MAMEIRNWTDAAFDVTLRSVSDYYGIPVSDVQGIRRYQRFCEPRSLAMHFLVAELGFTKSRVAQLFPRDHTTILHNVDLVNRRIGADRFFAATAEKVYQKTLRQLLAEEVVPPAMVDKIRSRLKPESLAAQATQLSA